MEESEFKKNWNGSATSKDNKSNIIHFEIHEFDIVHKAFLVL